MPNNFNMKKGTKGWVVRVSDNKWTELAFRDSKNKSFITRWIDPHYITIGAQRKMGHIKIVSEFSVTGQQIQGTVTSIQGDLLTRTIHMLLESLKKSADQGLVPSLGTKFDELVKTSTGLKNAATKIVKGVRLANLDGVLNTDFSLANIMNSSTRITAPATRSWMENESIIYARVYHQFEKTEKGKRVPDRSRKPAIYIGQTSTPSNRESQHNKNIREGRTSAHYRTARLARAHDTIALCRDLNADILDVAEQVFILLFQSYHPSLRKIELNEEATASTADVMREGLQWQFLHENAALLSQCAREVFGRTGWPGAVDRQSFGTSSGLNISSPLTELHRAARQSWCRIESETLNATTFRGPPFIARDDKKTITCFKLLYWGEKKRFELNYSFDKKYPPYPEPGTTVYPVFELMNGGRVHAYPLCGVLPTVGPWVDWLTAQSLALRIEWQSEEGSQWHVRWLNRTFKSVEPKDTIGAFRAYSEAMTLIHFLKQEFVQDRPPWMKNFGIASVKSATMNHLTQELCIKTLKNVINVPPPTLRPKAQIMDELQRLGARIAGWRDMPDSNTFPWKNWLGQAQFNTLNRARTACDTHYVLGEGYVASASQHFKDCQRVGQTNQCQLCIVLNRDCTWTDKALLRWAHFAPPENNRSTQQQQAYEISLKLQQALWFPKTSKQGAIIIDDAHISTIESVDEPEDIEGPEVIETGWVDEGNVSAWNAFLQALINSPNFLATARENGDQLISSEMTSHKSVTAAILEFLKAAEDGVISKPLQRQIFSKLRSLPANLPFNAGQHLLPEAVGQHWITQPLDFLNRLQIKIPLAVFEINLTIQVRSHLKEILFKPTNTNIDPLLA